MPVEAQKTICQNVPSRSADIHSLAFDSRAQAVHTQAAAPIATRFSTRMLWRCHSNTLPNRP